MVLMNIKMLTALALVAGASATHYGDPNVKPGCESDEQKISIQGLDGNLCSPACDASGSCPTDVPSGVTAQPTCALSGPSGKYCALVCSPTTDEASLRAGDAQCGTNASCKPIQGTGLCTYDDAPKPPPPPASEHWVPIDSPTFQAQSVCLDVGFTKDGKTGWAGAGQNGGGTWIIQSTDSGKTWAVVPDTSKPNLYLKTVVKDEKSAVVSGVIDQMYSSDGSTFKASTNAFVNPAQDGNVIPGSTPSFGLVGTGGAHNGILKSVTGQKWEFSTPLPDNATTFPARYAAFASESTWFVSAGDFPTNQQIKQDYHSLNKHASLHKTQNKVQYTHLSESTLKDPVDCDVDPANCYSAGIYKSTDAGKSWTNVFKNINKGDNIYPNGIDCISEEHCVAALEGDTCRILYTNDGGSTWTETMHDTDKACSLVAVKMISETEVWVSGGHMASLDFEGRYWHSTDGGKTWVKEAIKNLYVFSFDMVSADSGYSVALTAQSGVQLLKYRQSNSTLTTTFSAPAASTKKIQRMSSKISKKAGKKAVKVLTMNSRA